MTAPTVMMWFFLTVVLQSISPTLSFSTLRPAVNNGRQRYHTTTFSLSAWSSDFEDFPSEDDTDSESGSKIADLLQTRVGVSDLSACRSRQFSLGPDLVLADFVGKMGFEEVTDWEYYYQGEDDDSDERRVVQPNPFDSSQPKRTRNKSGSVVRLFRGEFVGTLGGMLSAKGVDRRVLVKEFTGEMALELATAELASVSRLQSLLLTNNGNKGAQDGEWIQAASARSVLGREDNGNLLELLSLLQKSHFLGIFGEVNLAELEDEMDPNDFYRALSVPPPKPGALWIVYEYAGFATLGTYAKPAELRRQSLPPKKGIFGNPIEPPRLPPWNERAKYVVQGILKGALEGMAGLHDAGLVHRSIGRSSVILSSTAMDKREASSPYCTLRSQLLVKLADFGFSVPLEKVAMDEDFCNRARSFGLFFSKGENSIVSQNFAIAEDMHAMAFVFMGVLLSSLAEVSDVSQPVPPTDEDTLQRLLGDIFDKDMQQFREYVEAEEVWSSLVTLLDENDSAGWNVLETLFNARERCVKFKESEVMLTARGLLTSPFFN